MNGINNMSNLKKLEKSRGVLLFAFNTKTVDYVSIADNSAKLITKNLNLPITLITDKNSTPTFDYNNILYIDSPTHNYRILKDKGIVEWKNQNRYAAYYLSPYHETILLDCDYLVLDTTLTKIFDTDFDYKLQYKMQTSNGLDVSEMGPISLPLVWATTVFFRKTKKSELLFSLVRKIQRNYSYYRLLFGVRDASYRNDFAFSMANIILNGYTIDNSVSVPWPLFTIEEKIYDINIDGKFIIIRFKDRAEYIAKQNIHIMDKDYLQSNNFRKILEII